ncbi:sel1 repeat family protein [Actinomadura algeriensis]|uniref:Sel1 repeat-containing protein n=1 Tax=Actinomadura algeriensis TaxID=1679523 RepID=A0ABR9JRE0_9ACTN|nr:sel1 repeat family protein [Actinomadura algeriensis]MBE1532979.1 hypothetical protein [Actinomadura algeriensis]
MEEQQPASWIPSEQTRMVETLISQYGFGQDVISRASASAAKAYKTLCPDLPDRLTPSTISRMKTGSDLKKLKRCNLLLLRLTIHHLRARGSNPSPPSPRAVVEANEFADTVLLAGGGSPGSSSISYNPNDPRHDRVAGNFGDYGVNLIEHAILHEDASSFRKLAILQWLSGDTDDARYWNNRAVSATSGPPEALDADVIMQEAFIVGRWYLYNEKIGVAETYLALAADAGHANSAYLLGDMLEALFREEEARRWFSVAWSSGHSEAGKRISAAHERR